MASVLASGENAADQSASSWPGKEMTPDPVAASQSRTFGK